MAIERSNDLRAFKGFIDEQFASGGADLTVDEALARWEYENSSEEERAETIQALQRGFADIEAGRVRPAEDFVREFRQKHGLPQEANVFDVLSRAGMIGCIKGSSVAPTDLATNPEHMDGFGRE
jgi:predicted transcriptional regulator